MVGCYNKKSYMVPVSLMGQAFMGRDDGQLYNMWVSIEETIRNLLICCGCILSRGRLFEEVAENSDTSELRPPLRR